MARRGGSLSGSKISQLLIELGADASIAAQQELMAGAELILADAKSRISNTSGKSTGKLAESGHIQKIGKKGNMIRIIFDAERDGYDYARIVEWRKDHRHPYLYVAYDAHRDQVKQRVMDAIRQAVRSHGIS